MIQEPVFLPDILIVVVRHNELNATTAYWSMARVEPRVRVEERSRSEEVKRKRVGEG